MNRNTIIVIIVISPTTKPSLSLPVDPPYMVFHIVDTTEDLCAALPLTKNTRVMLRLMTSTVLLATKAISRRLGTSLIATEEVLAVSVEVLPQITSSIKESL